MKKFMKESGIFWKKYWNDCMTFYKSKYFWIWYGILMIPFIVWYVIQLGKYYGWFEKRSKKHEKDI